ncbi:MAG: hypothetical protein EA342_13315 [Leptolyngbya sp. LCM1.Bin17]|nr:MAG: hypothetical protein EA342_13315 [Leptolyngbya sp. LCM1.Bin17]
MQNLLLRRLSLALGLPALALASLLGPTPTLAATQAVTDPAEPVMVANLGNILRDVNRGAQQVQQEIQRQQREQERREREAARQRQRQEQEAARQAATERRRLEAERQRQYFESLTPEQQQAYLAEQRARQAAQAEAAARIMWWFLENGDSSGNSSMGDEVDICLRHRIAACRNLD